jgi:hypothetical protein
MAVWGRARRVPPRSPGEHGRAKMPPLWQLFAEIGARAAAPRANALMQRHTFETYMDAVARRILFP